MSNNGSVREATGLRRLGPGPYLVFALVWLGFAHLVARYKTIEPLYLWILTQSLLLEKLAGNSRVATELSWLGIYMLLGLVAWRACEKPGAARSGWWKRAALAWLAIQIAYSLIAAALVWMGVLYE